jgi:hypothetical protein
MFLWKVMYDGIMTGKICMNSGFRCEVDDSCALLGHYAVSSGNLLLMFQDLSVPSSRGKNPKERGFILDCWPPEDGTDRLSWNIGKELPVRSDVESRAVILFCHDLSHTDQTVDSC